MSYSINERKFILDALEYLKDEVHNDLNNHTGMTDEEIEEAERKLKKFDKKWNNIYQRVKGKIK